MPRDNLPLSMKVKKLNSNVPVVEKPIQTKDQWYTTLNANVEKNLRFVAPYANIDVIEIVFVKTFST